MIDYPKLFEDIYEGVKNMIKSMKDFVIWLNTPIVNYTMFEPANVPPGTPGAEWFNILDAVGQIVLDVLMWFPKMILGLFESMLGVNLGQLTPAYMVIGNGIFILITLKIIKALVPLL